MSTVVTFDPRRLLAFRKSLGLSQGRFASSIGYSTEHIRMVERGEYQPSMNLLNAIALEYRVDLRTFFGRMKSTTVVVRTRKGEAGQGRSDRKRNAAA